MPRAACTVHMDKIFCILSMKMDSGIRTMAPLFVHKMHVRFGQKSSTSDISYNKRMKDKIKKDKTLLGKIKRNYDKCEGCRKKGHVDVDDGASKWVYLFVSWSFHSSSELEEDYPLTHLGPG